MKNKAKKPVHPMPQTTINPETLDREIASVYPVIDNDLARDNLENDIPEADLQDL